MSSALDRLRVEGLGGLLVLVVLVGGCPSADGTLSWLFDGPVLQTSALGALLAPPDERCSAPGGWYDVSGELEVIDLCLGVTHVERGAVSPCGARSPRFVRLHVEIDADLCGRVALTAGDAVVEVAIEDAGQVGRAEFAVLGADFDGGCGNVEDIGIVLGPWECADGTIDEESNLNTGWNFPAPQRR